MKAEQHLRAEHEHSPLVQRILNLIFQLSHDSKTPFPVRHRVLIFYSCSSPGASQAVGHTRVENLSVVVADFLTMLSQAVMTKLDGVIGYNFLKRFKVTIDYLNETLRLD